MSIDRRFVATVILLAVLAAATQAMLWLIRPAAPGPTFSGPPRSGYTLDNFSLNALDENGKLSFTVSGPRLTRRGNDGSIFVSTPQYLITDKDGKVVATLDITGNNLQRWLLDADVKKQQGDAPAKPVAANPATPAPDAPQTK